MVLAKIILSQEDKALTDNVPLSKGISIFILFYLFIFIFIFYSFKGPSCRLGYGCLHGFHELWGRRPQKLIFCKSQC